MRSRAEKIEVYCTAAEKKQIMANAKRNHLGDDTGGFLRTLGLSNAQIFVTVKMPKEIHLKDAHLGHISTQGREQKRATG